MHDHRSPTSLGRRQLRRFSTVFRDDVHRFPEDALQRSRPRDRSHSADSATLTRVRVCCGCVLRHAGPSSSVAAGQSEQADLERFVKRVKQVTGFAFCRTHDGSLWQPGYHERVLRDDESTLAVARYILENPVRAGLAKALGEWPLAGSDVYSWPELLTAWEDVQQT
jgi:hypothetical protein